MIKQCYSVMTQVIIKETDVSVIERIDQDVYGYS